MVDDQSIKNKLQKQNIMRNWFLKAKHWQLFLGMFVLPIIGYFALLGISIATESYETGIIGIFLIGIISLFFYFGWLWSIGTGLASKLPKVQPFNKGRFVTLFLIVVLFYFLFLAGGILLLPALVAMTASVLVGSIIALVYFLIIFGFFHTIYQDAKVLKAIETQRKVKFGDFVGEFFLLWFYIIGLWILQPKINEYFERAEQGELDTLDHLVE